MSKTRYLILTSLIAAASLTACSNAKEQLGITRSAPDEFAVVKRAPLEMPPDYSLRPPRPGAPRPQETAVGEQAREAIFGADDGSRKAAPATGEAALLQQAGAANTDSRIREVVDRETATMEPKDRPVAQRLFGIKLSGEDEDDGVLDPKKESARLKGTQPAPAAE